MGWFSCLCSDGGGGRIVVRDDDDDVGDGARRSRRTSPEVGRKRAGSRNGRPYTKTQGESEGAHERYGHETSLYTSAAMQSINCDYFFTQWGQVNQLNPKSQHTAGTGESTKSKKPAPGGTKHETESFARRFFLLLHAWYLV